MKNLLEVLFPSAAKTNRSTTMSRGNNNAITALHGYKHFGQWVFDDSNTGLVREAFVGGADTLLDELTGNGNKGNILFSTNDFPGATAKLTLLQTTPTGSTYWCERFNHNVWLCPALYLYHAEAPEAIFVHARAVI